MPTKEILIAILTDYFVTNGNAEDMAEEALTRLGGHNENPDNQ